MPIGITHIYDYLNIYDAPIELSIFVDAIIAIDNILVDSINKKLSAKSKTK